MAECTAQIRHGFHPQGSSRNKCTTPAAAASRLAALLVAYIPRYAPSSRLARRVPRRPEVAHLFRDEPSAWRRRGLRRASDLFGRRGDCASSDRRWAGSDSGVQRLPAGRARSDTDPARSARADAPADLPDRSGLRGLQRCRHAALRPALEDGVRPDTERSCRALLSADRLSCSSYLANRFRLYLHAAAYCLMHAFRQHVGAVSKSLGRVQFDTLRLRLLKIGAIVQPSVRRIWIRL